MICRECHGSGNCQHCHGTGFQSRYLWREGLGGTSTGVKCIFCSPLGSGHCYVCHGTGSVRDPALAGVGADAGSGSTRR